MKYENTTLPKEVQAFLEEIINDEELCDAFYDRDIEIYDEAMDRFIERHGFTRNLKTVYEYIVNGLTVRPYFQIFATDEDYVDSHSIFSQDEGQESLDALIETLSE